MMVIGCDVHPSFQQIVVLDMESGECEQRRWMHATGGAEQFYRSLVAPSRVGIESVGNSRWFVQLLEQLGHQVWIGDAAQVSSQLCAQAEDRQAQCRHILKPLVEDRFPRI